MNISKNLKHRRCEVTILLSLFMLILMPHTAFAERLSLSALQNQISSLEARLATLESQTSVVYEDSTMLEYYGGWGGDGRANTPNFSSGDESLLWFFTDGAGFRTIPASYYRNDNCYLASRINDSGNLTFDYEVSGFDCDTLHSVFFYGDAKVHFYMMPN